MHELGVVSSVLDIVIQRAEELGIIRVSAVHIVLGDDTGVSEDSFLFHWDLAAAGTVAEGAEITFDHEPKGGVRLAWIDVERATDPGARRPAPLAAPRGSHGDDHPHEHPH